MLIHHSNALKKLSPWFFYAFIPLAFFSFYLYSFHSFVFYSNHLPHFTIPPFSLSPPPFFLSSPPPPISVAEASCDYKNGVWVKDKLGPLYNDTTCNTIKEGQNCIAHGKADLSYLHWRWKPNQCKLQRFEPILFLQLFKNKHLAFVGDSMARNQLESLLCMLAMASLPNLVYSDEEKKFRRWHISSHNIVISVYWSPFLVEGVEKSNTGNSYNTLYLDRINERWAGDIGDFDMIVLSIGHWYLHPAVFFEGGSVLGCHSCPGLNHTEVGFYDVFRKALRTALDVIIERTKGRNKGIDVFLTTFSPAHFVGEWDNAGACDKTRPYEEGEKEVEGMDSEMRRVEVEEVEEAKRRIRIFKRVRIDVLDITKLSLMRPDGHPGPYMHPFPFADGVKDRVQNDCVHWCLPGPVDTWNEILLQIMRNRVDQSV